MVKLVKKEIITEAKQVGTLYHVTTLDAVANYMAPTDTLKGSGKYKNWLKGGRTDVVSFTRDKNFVVSTRATRQANVLFDFEVDGNKLSEKYKIFPYNDLAFDQNSGNLDSYPTPPKTLEHEEVVIGEIHPFSKFVRSARFCVSIRRLEEFVTINDNIQKSLRYLSKFDFQYDRKLIKFSEFFILNFSSFDDFLKKSASIVELLNNSKIKDGKIICDALSCFNKSQLQTLLKNELNYSKKNDRTIFLLETALSDKKEVLKLRLKWDDVKSYISKKDLKDLYAGTRINPYSQDSYLLAPYSTKELWDLLLKYGDFDTEQAYIISNKAKSWFEDHPNDIHTSTYGDVSERDFDRKINVYKMLDYLYTNYDRRKINRLLFDYICMNDKDIPYKEFNDLKDESIYTLGINKLKGQDLVDYLVTWGELLSEDQLNKILENMHE